MKGKKIERYQNDAKIKFSCITNVYYNKSFCFSRKNEQERKKERKKF